MNWLPLSLMSHRLLRVLQRKIGLGSCIMVTTNVQTGEVSSFSCDLSAIDQEQRKRHRVLSKDIILKGVEIKELPDGYGFRFSNDPLFFTALSEWATLEQLCCPFLTLTLELHPDQGPIWLKLTGRDGVKEFLRAELGI